MKKILSFIGIFIYLTTPVFSHGVPPGPTAEALLPLLALFAVIFIVIIIFIVGKIKYNWSIKKILGTFIVGLILLWIILIMLRR